jgi:Ser/Thr protein kinase RdoA (MazF antagonist)
VTLSPENLVYYLFERGLATRDSVVNGCIEISEVSRRNRNFKVRQRNGPGYFLKQVRRWEPETLRTLQAEAQCYQLATEQEVFADLRGIVPRFHSYDPRRAVLVTELLDGAETVTEHHFRSDTFPVAVAEQLGRAFGSYHRKAAANGAPAVNGLFPRRAAWALSLHDMPPQSVQDGSGGIFQMLGMIRQFPQFAEAFEKLRSEWRSDAVIHSDIKWDNCLLCTDTDGSPTLKVVDWEMADWGDSCWDVAAIFSAYLSFWVQSLPANGLANPSALVGQTRFPIERMQPAIRTFWSTYQECRGLSRQASSDLLRRSVRYAGARNIQTAFETLQALPQAHSGTVLLLQLSMNVLANPEEAARELLGIDL